MGQPGEVKYDRHYRESEAACGEAFAELVSAAEALGGPGVRVLDLGCGQGRDALLFARQGCTVLGVDLSSVGIGQLSAVARGEGLAVRVLVADIATFVSQETFDIVILDRVLHMLPDDATRLRVLGRAAAAVGPGGHVLIADGPKHRDLIRSVFTGGPWRFQRDSRNRTFVQRQ